MEQTLEQQIETLREQKEDAERHWNYYVDMYRREKDKLHLAEVEITFLQERIEYLLKWESKGPVL